MACSGLPIPADENSSIYVFDNIFADIGDDQSINDSLSTFSSHMTNIKNIIEECTSSSLILIDELGSGTDPLEGANLAIAILDYFKSKNCLCVVTTHYPELKKYALVTDSFENASVEFDISTLSPTYKLLVGIPGKSNAFEISQKLGLPNSIIEKAKSFMTKQDIQIEELLKKIYDDTAKIEDEKNTILLEREKVTKLRQNLEKDYSEAIQKEQNIINDAKLKAREILLDAKEEATDILKEMQDRQNSKDLNNLRNTLNKKIKDIHIDLPNAKNVTPINPQDIKPNTEVFVTTFQSNGIVLSNISKSNEVQVQIGSMKINVNIEDLENPQKTKPSKLNNFTSISKTKSVKTEINVIGYNVDEAIFVIDKFLDDCSLAKLQTVRIVHGKGTGKLRNGIHQFLKKHPHVKSYRLGTYGEGEMGVTVVELK